MKLNAIIVDDEPLARDLVSNLLNTVLEINVVGSYGTGKEAIKGINKMKPEILFLDIQLKDMTGFEILQKIKVKMPTTIFTTAYDEYAIDAFNIFAFDYLLKPYTEERFYKSVSRVLKIFPEKEKLNLEEKMTDLLGHVLSNKLTEYDNTKSRIPVPSGKKTVFVYKEDIKYVLASNYYVEIHTLRGKFVLRNSMYNILKDLNPKVFVRIHRSSIVNMGYVDELLNSAYGEIDARMQDGKLLRVSKGYRKQFLAKMGIIK